MCKHYPIFLIVSVHLLFLSISDAFPQNVKAIDDSLSEQIFPLDELEYYEDTTNNLTFLEISSLSFQENFKTDPHYRNKVNNSNASYWIRLKLRHQKASEKIWLLEFYDQTIDHIEAYIPDRYGDYHQVVMGDMQEFSNRTFLHKNFEILLENDHDEVITYYFKIQSNGFADIRIALRSIDRFIYYALNEYFLFGLFYGMILILSLYNLLMYFAIKEIKYVYYIFYLLSVGIYSMCMDGTAFQYLWPNSPNWNQFAYGIFIYSIILWSLLFSQRFLNTKTKAPFLHKLFSITILVRTAFFVISLFHLKLFEHRYIELLPLVLIFYTSIYVLVKGYKQARFFVMAYGILFIGFFAKALVNYGVLPFGIISHYSLHISFLLEMLFLSFALGDRIRIIKHKRDLAQQRIIQAHEINVALKDKVNRELEQKVKERTIALSEKNKLLEESNQKLVQQAKEINQINSMLDLDNWKLKNNIKEGLVDRFLHKELNFEQFKSIFPDKLACYRYLEKIKWDKGFTCKKCQNDKYFDGIKKFSRRCTRCGYNESITAYTIFHGIKFPIEKAFYIAYIVMGNKDITLEELSQLLDLRINTVWSFKNKVSILITELKKRNNSNWQQLLVSVAPKSLNNYKKKKQNKKLIQS